MKKNLMSVLILALVFVNIILTAILAFSILPSVKKTNQLVDAIASAVNLEIEGGKTSKTSSVPMSQISTYDLEDSMTINFKAGDDGKDHYVVLEASISMDTKSDGYKEYGETISEKASIIKNEINSVVSGYTYEEFRDNQQEVQNQILENLQGLFDSDFIVSVGFTSVTCQ